MPDYAQKPTDNTPVALRLVPRITGWSVAQLVNILTTPVEYVPKGVVVFYLQVYQWNDRRTPTLKPVSALMPLLQSATKADDEHGAIAAIPRDLFLYSDDLDGGYLEYLSNNAAEPLFVHGVVPANVRDRLTPG